MTCRIPYGPMECSRNVRVLGGGVEVFHDYAPGDLLSCCGQPTRFGKLPRQAELGGSWPVICATGAADKGPANEEISTSSCYEQRGKDQVIHCFSFRQAARRRQQMEAKPGTKLWGVSWTSRMAATRTREQGIFVFRGSSMLMNALLRHRRDAPARVCIPGRLAAPAAGYLTKSRWFATCIDRCNCPGQTDSAAKQVNVRQAFLDS